MELIFSIEEIEDAAKKFLVFLQEKKVIAFHGEMGTGKTTFIKSLCSQLKVKETVSSPTFSIINQYQTADDKTIFHLDLYRLKDEEEALQAGVEECFYSNELCFIEWPEKAISILPADTVHAFIDVIDETKRRLSCKLQ